MATKKKSQGTSRNNGGDQGQSEKRASQKDDEYGFASNLPDDDKGTVPESEYQDYAIISRDDVSEAPDVLLDVPVVKVDEINFELEDLRARVSLQAQVLDLLELSVGADVSLGRVALEIKGVEAQALLKVRLDNVAAIVDRVLTTIDRNPELVRSLGRTVESVGRGAGHAVGQTGEALESIGSGARGAVKDIGSGAGQAVGQLGPGLNEAVSQVGEG